MTQFVNEKASFSTNRGNLPRTTPIRRHIFKIESKGQQNFFPNISWYFLKENGHAMSGKIELKTLHHYFAQNSISIPRNLSKLHQFLH